MTLKDLLLNMQLKDAVAVYGAIVSSLVAAWNVFLFITDRGKLKVNCYIGELIGDGEVLESGVIVYSVTNVGRKPIYVTHVGGKFKRSSGERRHFFITPRNQFPMKLEPGQNITEYASDPATILRRNRLRSLHAIDSLGHYHNVKRKVMRKLLKDVSVNSEKNGQE